MSLQEVDFLANMAWLSILAVTVPSMVVVIATVHRSRPHMLASRMLEVFHPVFVPLMMISTVLDLVAIHSVPVRVFDCFSTLVSLAVIWRGDPFAPCPTCRTGLWKRAWHWLWRPVSVPQHSF